MLPCLMLLRPLRPCRFPVLPLCAALCLLAAATPSRAADPLVLAAWRGATAAQLTAALGAPLSSEQAAAPGAPLLATAAYALPGGEGTLTVRFCQDRAYAFDLVLARGAATAEALLARGGLSAAALPAQLREASAAQWRDGELRVLALRSDEGWTTLSLLYDEAC